MDAHLFRRLAPALARVLDGARVERIHAPLPEVTVFRIFTRQAKRALVLRGHKAEPLLFLTDKSPLPNPAFPPARVMLLRKHAEDRRLGPALIDWVGRRLALPLPGENNQIAGYLMLDLREGALYLPALPQDFPRPALWPEPSALPDLLSGPAWQDYPTLSPLLRRTLAALSPPDQAALLVDLEAGDGDLFAYGTGGRESVPALLSAWPLPPEQTPKGMAALPLDQDGEALLAALRAVSEPKLLALAEEGLRKERAAPGRAQDKRRNRLLNTLLKEEERLTAVLARRGDAVSIQAQLWRLDKETKQPFLDLEAEGESPARRIPLDERLTLRENMAALFRQSDRAARGLAMLTPRIAALRAGELQPLPGQQGKASPPVPAAPASTARGQQRSDKAAQAFLSSDGFLLLRGKNAEGNREILRRARPFDLWFHAEDGPSTHLILKRDHAAQEVPESTLLEAATLVALKSWQRGEAKARVFCALAKHVHPIKGAAPGTVRVDSVLQSFLAPVDAALEERLKQA